MTPARRKPARKERRRPLAVDLFSGAGGFALGIEQAGFDVVAAVEYDPIHAAAHEFNFPLTNVVCADASTMTGDKLRAAVVEGARAHGLNEPEKCKVDLVFGGPPCQGFSSGGKRRPGDERNLLIFDFARLVDELQPRYFVMENVPPLRNYVEERDLKILDRFVLEMEACGYNVLPPQILNASRWGVPQDRRRLIVLGSKKKLTSLRYPTPTVRPVKKRAGDDPKPWEVGGRDEDVGLPVGPTVLDAIGDLPDLDRFPELWKSDEVTLTDGQRLDMEKAASVYAKRLRGTDVDPDDRARPRERDPQQLTASMRTGHELTTIARFEATDPGDSEEKSRFYRLDGAGLCSTIRAGTGYERGSFMAPRPIHPTRPRVISPREAARLHSFPDWFRFHVTKWHAFRQIGNSLPPLLARAIGQEVVRALNVTPTRFTRPMPLGDTDLLSLDTRGAAKHFGADIDLVPSHKRRLRKDRDQPGGRSCRLTAAKQEAIKPAAGTRF